MLVRRLLVALLALLGVAALAAGVAMRTVWLPEDEVQSSFSAEEPTSLLVTSPGLLEARPGPVTVEVTSDGDVPLVLAVGRERDVQAWVADAAHTTVTGFTTAEVLSGETTPGESEVPDPAGSDLWVQATTGEGTASLEYAQPEGRYLLLAGADGVAPAPEELTLTWSREVTTPWAIPLIALGALLLFGAVALLVQVRRHVGARRSEVVSRPGPTAVPADEDAR